MRWNRAATGHAIWRVELETGDNGGGGGMGIRPGGWNANLFAQEMLELKGRGGRNRIQESGLGDVGLDARWHFRKLRW